MPGHLPPPLAPPWDHYLARIAASTTTFWEERQYPGYARLQGPRTWERLIEMLEKILPLLNDAPLSNLERFLLFASAYLYETGWQVNDAPSLTPAQRYRESGQEIRKHFARSDGRNDFGLSVLKSYRLTVEALAQICELVGNLVGGEDISQHSQPQQAGNQETARLAVLATLLYLANLLLVPRGRDWYLRTVPAFATRDCDDARLALDPYVALVDITNNPLTVYYSIHAQDQMLAEKMSGLFEEPIKRWWARSWQWLACAYRIRLTFNKPVIEIMQPQVPLEPLEKTCPALLNFLDSYNPPAIVLPSLEEVEEYCKSRAMPRVEADLIKISPSKLRELMLSAYSRPNFMILCADLGVDYDNLRGENLETRMLYLIDDFRRQRKYAILVNKVLADHPYLANEL